MDELIINKLKNKIDKLEHKQEEKYKREIEKIKKSTEKIYYKIWRLIIKNIKKESFSVSIYVKNNSEGDQVVTTIDIDDSCAMITYSLVCLPDLVFMFEQDGLELNYQFKNTLGRNIYKIDISKYKLKSIIEKEIEPVRPDRSSHRKVRHQTPVFFIYR